MAEWTNTQFGRTIITISIDKIPGEQKVWDGNKKW